MNLPFITPIIKILKKENNLDPECLKNLFLFHLDNKMTTLKISSEFIKELSINLCLIINPFVKNSLDFLSKISHFKEDKSWETFKAFAKLKTSGLISPT
jgi:hypothetical protein